MTNFDNSRTSVSYLSHYLYQIHLHQPLLAFYIVQTYTYSWENHFCEAAHLQRRFAELVHEADFDFRVFLQKLSAVVYKPLLYLVHFSRSSELNQQWNITKFNACLPLQPKRDELADNGNDYVERVAHLFEDALADLPQFEPKVFENLDETNAYLHIQGHQLYKLVLYIGTMLCHGKGVAFKTTFVRIDFQFFISKNIRL